ncbi:acyltransferase [Pantoea cypripedii]|uniref:Acyltransferase n=1 Tax=Pantoea cypripedii TaxID=55209 RepID=A0A6B9G8X1_PANCY|nr:acyltransferase [Pantoea cypripedii]QGY32293.1 acyltransferase [Pantoea cypripedii]
MIKKLKFRFLFAFIRAILYKIKYGSNIEINPFKVYISSSVKIAISGNGRIIIKSEKDRVFISRNTTIHCSSGVLEIGNGVFFNENNQIVCHESIVIGDDCMFGPNVCLYDSDHFFEDRDILIRNQGYKKKKVVIGEDVWIGAGSVLTKGTIIGRHTVIGANAVVRGILNGNSVYAGNPVKLLKELS